MLHGNILSHILSFSHVRDIPTIATICFIWNAALGDVYDEICRRTVHRHYPRLHELKLLEEECLAGGTGTGAFATSTYRGILKRRLTMQYKPTGLNQEIQKDVHTIFAHRGIVGFSNCCSRCTESYYEYDPTFRLRHEEGILCFKAYLNGPNFTRGMCDGVAVCYGELKYINDHWEEECKLMDLWCRVVGLEKGDYSFEKPKCINCAVMVELKDDAHVELEEPLYHFLSAAHPFCTIQ